MIRLGLYVLLCFVSAIVEISFQDLCVSPLGDTSLCILLLAFILRFAIDFLSI